MGESEHDADMDDDDDAPDLSTPEWEAIIARAPVHPGIPTESTPYRVEQLPDGYVRLSYRRLNEKAKSDSGTGVLVAAGASFSPRISDRVRGVLATSAAAKLYERSEWNEITAGGDVGITRLFERGSASGGIGVGRLWTAGEPERRNLGPWRASAGESPTRPAWTCHWVQTVDGTTRMPAATAGAWLSPLGWCTPSTDGRRSRSSRRLRPFPRTRTTMAAISLASGRRCHTHSSEGCPLRSLRAPGYDAMPRPTRSSE